MWTEKWKENSEDSFLHSHSPSTALKGSGEQAHLLLGVLVSLLDRICITEPTYLPSSCGTRCLYLLPVSIFFVFKKVVDFYVLCIGVFLHVCLGGY